MSTIDPSTAPIPSEGEIMMLAFHQDQHRWRPVVYIGPPHEPNHASQIYLGDWRSSLRKAQLTGLKHYFQLYAQRYGMRHPQDPLSAGLSGPQPYNVVSWQA